MLTEEFFRERVLEFKHEARDLGRRVSGRWIELALRKPLERAEAEGRTQVVARAREISGRNGLVLPSDLADEEVLPYIIYYAAGMQFLLRTSKEG